jgi:ABC-2 type transport system permease protein
MRAVIAHTKMEFTLFYREYISLFFTFVLPAAMFIFFGFIFEGQMYGGLNYFQAYIPSMIAIIIFTTGFFTLGLQIVIEREKGVFRRLLATPLKPKVFLFSILCKGILAIIGGAIQIILLGYFLFGEAPTPYLFQFSLALLLSSLAFFALGFIIASVANKMQVALAISFILMYPMLFLSGATMPLETFPESIQAAANFIPLTYVVEILQLAWTGQLFTQASIFSSFVLLGFLIVGSFVGVRFFRWT